MSPSENVSCLDPSVVALITDHLSIHVAAVTPQGLPTLVRGLGCRVNEAGDSVTVLVAKSQAVPVLAAVSQSGRVAAVFNQPETHRTLQLKGIDAVVEPATDLDKANLLHYLKRFSQRLEIYNVQEIFVHTLCACEPDDLVGICFTPITAFQQTPGRSAGNKIPVGGMLP